MLYGIDIASWQERLNLHNVATDFVIIKATGGRQYVNPMLDIHYKQAKAKGILKGLYHFVHEEYCKGNAFDEANHFCNIVKPYLDGQTILVIDNEADNERDVQYMCDFAQTVINRTGIIPLIYMNQNAENTCNWSPLVKMNVGLWLANHGANYEKHGFDVKPKDTYIANWPFIAMHQYSSKTLLNGYVGHLDANQFFGDRTAWIKYATPQNKPCKPQPQPAKPPTTPQVWHTVQKGENLSTICLKYGVRDWQSVARMNRLANPNLIHPGQKLKIK